MRVLNSRFKTLEQLLQEQGEEQEVKPLVFTDHTGKEDTTRIIGAGLNPIQVDRNAIGFEVSLCFGYDSQMIYNIESLTAQEENRILQYGSKNRRQETMKQEKTVSELAITDLQQLLEQLKTKMETDSANMMSLTDLVQRIQRFLEESKLLPPHPVDVLSFFEELQIDFPVEYYRYKVFQLLPWTLQPSIEREFLDWNPLEVQCACRFELQEADSFVELVQHVKDVILVEEEEEESHLFDYNWLEKSPKKKNDESRFLVTVIFTNTLLKPIREKLDRSFNLFSTTHFTNYAKLLNASRDIWENATIFDNITTPIVQKLKRCVRIIVFVHFQLADWSPKSAFNQVEFFGSILRYQTVLPGFKVDMSN